MNIAETVLGTERAKVKDLQKSKAGLRALVTSQSKEIMALSKTDLGILIRNVTGHAHLARHNAIANTEDKPDQQSEDANMSLEDNAGEILDTVDINKSKHSAICRLCQLRGMEETPLHLVLECPATWKERAELFMKHEVNNVDLLSWKPDRLVRFFAHYNLEQEVCN